MSLTRDVARHRDVIGRIKRYLTAFSRTLDIPVDADAAASGVEINARAGDVALNRDASRLRSKARFRCARNLAVDGKIFLRTDGYGAALDAARLTVQADRHRIVADDVDEPGSFDVIDAEIARAHGMEPQILNAGLEVDRGARADSKRVRLLTDRCLAEVALHVEVKRLASDVAEFGKVIVVAVRLHAVVGVEVLRRNGDVASARNRVDREVFLVLVRFIDGVDKDVALARNGRPAARMDADGAGFGANGVEPAAKRHRPLGRNEAGVRGLVCFRDAVPGRDAHVARLRNDFADLEAVAAFPGRFNEDALIGLDVDASRRADRNRRLERNSHLVARN